MTEIQNPVKTIAPIFPRLFAFIIDCLIVGVACLVMGKCYIPILKNSIYFSMPWHFAMFVLFLCF